MYHQPKRIEFLDSIRGLAALFVLLAHSVSFHWPTSVLFFLNLPVINIFFDGYSAVTMFFVLSGFVLSRPYLLPVKKGGRPRTFFLPTFYLRRFTRIWIPWFFVFCLSAVAAKYFFREYQTIPADMWNAKGEEWHLPLTLMSAVKQALLMNISGLSPHLVSADWSLGVELRGSLLIPFLCFLSKGGRIITLPFVAILLFILSPHGFYVSFVLGVALARGCDGITKLLGSFPGYAKWLLFATGILFYESRHIATAFLHLPVPGADYYWVFGSVGCVLILAVSLSSAAVQKVLNHRALVYLGRISYSVFLLQFIAIFCLQPFVVHALNSVGVTQTFILLPVSFAASVFPTLALATVTYWSVELPAIELGHRMTSIIQKRFLKA
jgi:peptidoglycan/LPS O-acetylase OafA/YrhL